MIRTRVKVISSSEMARIEAIAFSQGETPLAFMEQAAVNLGEKLLHLIDSHHLDPFVTLLPGKGHNGGDGFAASAFLLKKGIAVTAYAIHSMESLAPLCQEMRRRFLEAGGKLIDLSSSDLSSFHPKGLILDALFGTGFEGSVEGQVRELIVKANDSGLLIVSIDIPSGLHGDSGVVKTSAIKAWVTLFLELPKLGFFLDQGWDHVGQLQKVSFGLKETYLEEAKASAFFPSMEEVSTLLPPIKRTSHKYERGYVIGVGGALGMEGATTLAGWASLVSGAGIVRLFSLAGPQLAHFPYELIWDVLDDLDDKKIFQELQRAKSIWIGPGMGRDGRATQILAQILPEIRIPCVLDGDALYDLARYPKESFPKECVLTPHREELRRLLMGVHLKGDQESFLHSCQTYANRYQVVLVAKGAPTWIFSPQTVPFVIGRGDPGMATAGSGDVLTGILAAFLAQGLKPLEASILAVYLHGLAGERGAQKWTSYAMTASSIVENLSFGFMTLQQETQIVFALRGSHF